MFGAVVAIVAVLLAACDRGASTASTTTPPVAGVGTTQVAGTPSTSRPTLGPQELLSEAVAPLQSGYQFAASVMVDGREIAAIDGRVVGSDKEMRISSSAADLEYVSSSAAAWTRIPGGEWEELDGPPPAVDPLAALRAPLTVDIAPEGSGADLVARYPGSAFGVEDDELVVELTLDAGRLVEIRYTAVTAGIEAVSTTVFSDLVDSTPIVLPSI